MKPQDLFGLAVRIAGLWLFFFSGWYLVYALSVFAGVETNVERAEAEAGAYLFNGVIYLLVAFYFLRGAPVLMRFSYPAARTEDQTTSQPPPSADEAPPRS